MWRSPHFSFLTLNPSLIDFTELNFWSPNLLLRPLREKIVIIVGFEEFKTDELIKPLDLQYKMEVKCKVIFIYPKYVDHIKGCIQNYGLNFSILLFNLRFCRLREGSIKLYCPTQLYNILRTT